MGSLRDMKRRPECFGVQIERLRNLITDVCEKCEHSEACWKRSYWIAEDRYLKQQKEQYRMAAIKKADERGVNGQS